ncbi:exosome component 10 [Ostrinia furnacalis]|uniref:exosome component 10 n=1 Tax=Ostrinia furnacalis TaxID=93504 RepID=UPI00103B4DCE|nr:exosome component 10 [Ostrinia furnacalis]
MNSVLNPEAPEFYPHLTTVTQGGYTTVHRTIRSTNQMPVGASYDIFKTFTDFNVVTCQLSENVVVQSNQILVTELPAVKLKLNDNEYNTEKVVDANDSMLDRVNLHVDMLSGALRPSAAFLGGLARPPAPVIAKIEVGSTMFIGAKNIPRPQLLFKEPVDNSDSLWVPKISDKPNNIKPLALNILYNENGEAVGYEHPYKVELELYQPPSWLLEPEPEAPAFPPPPEDTRLTLVETAEQLDRLVAHLGSVRELAVDLEHHSYRSYQGITCLIQISTDEGGDFIVDALAAREHVHKLNVIFTDPTKLKVFHGAESDVLWLQRDFGVYVVGLFDTHRAARALGLPLLSLKGLLAHYCNVSADKKFQLADWRIRPLPAELVAYARGDTHYLLYVARRLRRELRARAASPRLLLAVLDASRQLCGATYNKEAVRDDSHLALYVRSRKKFNSQQMAALQLLYKWRDAHARELDESTTYLLPNHMLVALAESLPRELQGVSACCSPTPPFVKQNLLAIHRLLLSVSLPLQPPR